MQASLGFVLEQFAQRKMPLDLFELQVIDWQSDHWYEWQELPEVCNMQQIVIQGEGSYDPASHMTYFVLDRLASDYTEPHYLAKVYGNWCNDPRPPAADHAMTIAMYKRMGAAPEITGIPAEEPVLKLSINDNYITIDGTRTDMLSLDTECECGASMDPDQMRCVECGKTNQIAALFF